MKLNDTFGWLGVASILTAYALITTNVFIADDWEYGALNIFGAASLVWSSFSKHDYQPVALNVVWFAIAAFGLIKALA